MKYFEQAVKNVKILGFVSNNPYIYIMKRTDETDCKSEDGITVGLIDSIISISRILKSRNLESKGVRESLIDLRCDKDLERLLKIAESHCDVSTGFKVVRIKMQNTKKVKEVRAYYTRWSPPVEIIKN